MKDKISFDEFLEIEKKLEIRIGTIKEIERVPKSKKLLKLLVSFGEEERVCVTNIGDKIEDPETKLSNLLLPFIMNLEPVTMMGIESTVMIMVVEDENGNIDFDFNDGGKLL